MRELTLERTQALLNAMRNSQLGRDISRVYYMKADADALESVLAELARLRAENERLRLETKHEKDFINSVGVVEKCANNDAFVREHLCKALLNLQWKIDNEDESNTEAQLRTIGELMDENERLRAEATAMRAALMGLSEDLRSDPEIAAALATDAGAACQRRLAAAEAALEFGQPVHEQKKRLMNWDGSYDGEPGCADDCRGCKYVAAVAAWQKERGQCTGSSS